MNKGSESDGERIAKRSKRPCDFCRKRKRKCDGMQPCATCIKSKNGPSNCTYLEKAIPRQNKEVTAPVATTENDIQYFVQDDIFKTPVYGMFESPIQGLQNPEVEYHLLDLSFMTIAGFSADADFTVTQPQKRKFPMSQSLKRALCFNSIFYSTHPMVFKTPNPSLNERVTAAQLFAFDDSLINPLNNQEMCDDIRSVLVYANTQFSLGNKYQGKAMIEKCVSLMRQFGLLENSKNETNGIISIDELVSDMETLDFFDNGTLSDRDIVERMSLYSFLLGVDTFASIGSKKSYSIDDTEIADVLYPPAITPQPVVQITRRCVPTLAKHTLWDNTPYACLYDDTREFAVAINQYHPDARTHAQFSIQLNKFMRRVVNFSRHSSSPGNTIQLQSELHNTLLQFMYQSPVQLLPFKSLQPFLWGSNPSSLPQIATKHSKDVVQNTLVLLCGFSCLHLASSQYQNGLAFAVEFGGPTLYSSFDIMYASLNILAFLIQTASTPLSPQESAFGYYPYHPVLLQECFKMSITSSLPSPIFCHSFNAMLGYIVSSSTLISCKNSNNIEQSQSANYLAKEIVYPAIQKIGEIWPGVKTLTRKLRNLCDGL